MCRKLAPRRDMLELPYVPFREIYLRDILGPLNPREILADLHELAGAHEPALLCFERPPWTATNWCHRRLVADWFGDQLGQDVPELEPVGDPPTP